MKIIQNQSFDQERALYGEQDILLKAAPLTDPRTEKARLKNARAFK